MSETEFHPRATSSASRAWNKVVFVFLVVAILGAFGALGYIITLHPEADRFTQFYILGPEGKATGYPTKLAIGEEGEVIVGVVNHEQETMIYGIEVRIGGAKNLEIGPIVLEHDEKLQERVGFAPHEAGKEVKVEFLLYKQGQRDVYKSLWLWIDITEQD